MRSFAESIGGNEDRQALDDLTILHVNDAIGLGGKLFVMGHDDEGGPARLIEVSH